MESQTADRQAFIAQSAGNDSALLSEVHSHLPHYLKLAGFEAPRNYTGSWKEWGDRVDLPIEHPSRKTSKPSTL